MIDKYIEFKTQLEPYKDYFNGNIRDYNELVSCKETLDKLFKELKNNYYKEFQNEMGFYLIDKKIKKIYENAIINKKKFNIRDEDVRISYDKNNEKIAVINNNDELIKLSIPSLYNQITCLIRSDHPMFSVLLIYFSQKENKKSLEKAFIFLSLKERLLV